MNAPWCNRKLKLCIKKKYKLYIMMKRSIVSRRLFNIYKKLLIYINNKLRQDYYLNKFRESFHDQKRNWSNINEILNRKKSTEVNEVEYNGQNYKGDQLPNVFNYHFVNVIPSLTSNLPKGINFEYFEDILSIPHSCFLNACTNFEMCKTLETLGNKGNVLYDIPSKYIRLVSNKIIPVLVYIFNLCLEKGVYPDLLKVARVIPLHKAGSRSDINNYRPISILLSFNKVFEKIICLF